MKIQKKALLVALVTTVLSFSVEAVPFDAADQQQLIKTQDDYLQGKNALVPIISKSSNKKLKEVSASDKRLFESQTNNSIEISIPPATNNEDLQRQALKDQQNAFLHYDEECNNRRAAYESLAAAQTKRDEQIAIWGLIFGFAGTLSTVTDVARALSGIAGLAPTVSKSLSDNGDNAQATHNVLVNLNQKIIDDAKKYFDLPNPIPGDTDFDKAFYNKQNAVMTLFVDCRAYYAANKSATNSQSSSQSSDGQGGATQQPGSTNSIAPKPVATPTN